MNFNQELKKLKIEIDRELEKQFNIAIREAKKEDELIAKALEQTKKIALAGGKRIRGALLYWAYFGTGGGNRKKILKIAAAIELVHLFLLAHDDVIDRGEIRHGEKTLNAFFKAKNFTKNDREHFGNSMAIICGEMLYAIANRIIAESGFKNEDIVSAIRKLQSVVETTIIGQSQDLAIAHNKKVTQGQVLSMYRNKTAKYTFEGPIHLGAILAGCKNKNLFFSLTKYAVPLGIAFQIQDDILGIFGNEIKIGKSIASDIEEDKKSIIVLEAKKRANQSQLRQIESILGKKKLTSKEIKTFKDIIKSTGSLEYSKKMAKKYLKKGTAEIEKMNLASDSKKFLLGLAEYLDNREV